MKKVILLVCLVSVLVAGEMSQAHKELAGKLVRVFGYSCATVDNAIRSSWDGSITVYCDGHRYKYEVKDVGGRWQVKVK